ncbi:MAG: L,D-transpeptidase [Sandaracinaceae bacterium]
MAHPPTTVARRALLPSLALLLLGAGCSGRGEEEPPEPPLAESAPTTPEHPDEGPRDAGHDHGPPRPPAKIFARRFVAKVREQPDRDSFRIGYLRAGAVLQATTGHPVRFDDPRCRGGWYELTTGGFVCNGHDVIAFWGDRLPELRGSQPDRTEVLPYMYGRNHVENAPMYQRLPTYEEALEHETDRAARRRAEAAAEAGAQAPSTAVAGAGSHRATGSPATGAGAGVGAAATTPEAAEEDGAGGETSDAEGPGAAAGAGAAGGEASAAPSAGAPPERGAREGEPSGGDGTASAAPAGAEGPDRQGASGGSASTEDEDGGEDGDGDGDEGPVEEEEEEEEPITLDQLAGDPDSVVRRRMMDGFIVSLDRHFRAGGRRYWRTINNGFVPVRSVMRVRPPPFRGFEVGEGEDQLPLPIGYTMRRRETQRYRRFDTGRVRPRGGTVDWRTRFRIVEEVDGETPYWVADNDTLFRQRDITAIAPRPRPNRVGPDDKWIEINLTDQYLIAYEGDTPVYATLISSGRAPRTPEEADYLTPTGLFRIRAKHLAATMDGDSASDGPYSIDDVPYVMYFQLAYALHSAFWHNMFGRPVSHGCVNLPPLDARWIFDWSDPQVPEGWHGAYPTEENPGTWLYIHGRTPGTD